MVISISLWKVMVYTDYFQNKKKGRKNDPFLFDKGILETDNRFKYNSIKFTFVVDITRSESVIRLANIF